MAEPEKPAASAASASSASSAPKTPASATENPAFRMLGLPRLRARLPSRNWMIFFTLVGSFTTGVVYDRRAKRRAQQKWCNAVSYLSEQTIDPQALPRKLTVYLSAPPGDGLRPSREYFQEYVKPILVASAVDWEVVEARKEGELRARVAERIRRKRRARGEAEPKEDEIDVVVQLREGMGIKPADERGGELVVGRHTWKEYVRGLHEGWLGPVLDPKEELEVEQEQTRASKAVELEPQNAGPVADLESVTSGGKAAENASPAANTAEETDKSKDVKDEKPAKPFPPPSLIVPAAYQSAQVAPTTPEIFPPATVLAQPHILGFLNTPTRMYRFFTRRRLADATGQQVAMLLTADDFRSFEGGVDAASGSDLYGIADKKAYAQPIDDDSLMSNASETASSASPQWEQEGLLTIEESDWHKSAREPRAEGKDAVWIEPMTIDARIGMRMRTPTTSLFDSSASSSSGDFLSDPAADGDVSVAANPPSTHDDGRIVRGNARDWKGGVDRGRTLGWWEWLVEASGFADAREPRGLFAKDGLVGDAEQ